MGTKAPEANGKKGARKQKDIGTALPAQVYTSDEVRSSTERKEFRPRCCLDRLERIELGSEPPGWAAEGSCLDEAEGSDQLWLKMPLNKIRNLRLFHETAAVATEPTAIGTWSTAEVNFPYGSCSSQASRVIRL